MNFPQLVGKRCLGVGIPGWRWRREYEFVQSQFSYSDTIASHDHIERNSSYISLLEKVLLSQLKRAKPTYSDVTWHDGQFYGVDVRGHVIILDFRGHYGCKANHIYFTDDCSAAYYSSEKGGGKDMGIYSDTIEPHYTGESYHRFSPPIWIFNTPFSA
ncbi:hypothetical protein R3W88_011251 [Solanum pinnatisectum]|uniref:DUF295 domain-containing protein n=1 Tax=Solanum pinnatisectum TaxID=50273 RepID=A0AAV9L6W6_9SOLN|nr:hypothetical protein R3W88_011251 [Solanum pinnatisectum]